MPSTSEQKTAPADNGSQQFVTAFNESYTGFFKGVAAAHAKYPALTAKLQAHLDWCEAHKEDEEIVRRMHEHCLKPCGTKLFERKLGYLNAKSALYGDHDKYPRLAKKLPEGGDLRLFDFAAHWDEKNRKRFWDEFLDVVRIANFAVAALDSESNIYDRVIAPYYKRIESGEIRHDELSGELIADLLEGKGEISGVFRDLVQSKKECASLIDNIGNAVQPNDGTVLDLGPLKRLITEELTDKDRKEAVKAMKAGTFGAEMRDSMPPGMAEAFQAGEMPDIGALIERAASEKNGGGGGQALSEEDRQQLSGVQAMFSSLQQRCAQMQEQAGAAAKQGSPEKQAALEAIDE